MQTKKLFFSLISFFFHYIIHFYGRKKLNYKTNIFYEKKYCIIWLRTRWSTYIQTVDILMGINVIKKIIFMLVWGTFKKVITIYEKKKELLTRISMEFVENHFKHLEWKYVESLIGVLVVRKQIQLTTTNYCDKSIYFKL